MSRRCPAERTPLVQEGTWWRCPTCEQRYLLPLPGFQSRFTRSSADILFAAGGGGAAKTVATIFSAARWTPTAGYRAWLVRAQEVDLHKTDGLIDKTAEFYEPLGGRWSVGDLTWRFPCANRGESSIQLVHTGRGYRNGFQGPSAAFLGIDELDQIPRDAFWWLVGSRLRSSVAPVRVRATLNPTLDSWVYEDLARHWVGEDGDEIPEMVGRPMYLAGINGAHFWGRTREEAARLADVPPQRVQSVGYMTATLADNAYLAGTGYEGRLGLLGAADSIRFGAGPVRWARKADQGSFQRRWFEHKIVEEAPPGTRWRRIWDLAATGGDEHGYSYTSGLLMGLGPDKRIYIGHLVCGRWDDGDVEKRLLATAGLLPHAQLADGGAEPGADAPEQSDAPGVPWWLCRERAGAGKSQLGHMRRLLLGREVEGESESGDKDVRQGPLKAAAKNGNVYLVRGPWIETFLRHLCRPGRPDDVKDCASAGYEQLTQTAGRATGEDLAKAYVEDRHIGEAASESLNTSGAWGMDGW